ncbi:MAG: TonB family protein [Bacteriovoracales bacterium]|nr:TonB family protein [Bacteriovoracales bacterium]
MKVIGGFRGDDPLYKYMALIFLAHLSFFAAFYLLGSLKSSFFLWKKNSLKVVQSSVRVDVVGMPKFTLKELRQMGALADSSGKGAVSVGKKKSVPSFLDKIKNFSKKTVKVKKVKTKKGARGSRKTRLEKDLGGLVVAGNKLSKGPSLVGDVNTKDLSKLHLYMESLPQFVRPHWILPSYLKESEKKCRIQIFIGKEGKLLKSAVMESSGDPQYDNYALAAIQRTQFPVPEPDLVAELASGVVVLGFPL